MTDNVVPMGHITNAFGVKGWVKIRTSTETPDSLGKYKEILLLLNGSWLTYNLEDFFAKDDIFHAKLSNISDRDQAIALKGVTVGIWRSQLPAPQGDEYYWVDLIGLTVMNLRQETLGIIDNLMETGGNTVLIVKSPDKEHLIPFVKHYVQDVDFNAKKVVVDWELDY